VKALAGREIQALEAIEIQAVVDVPTIRCAAAFRDKSLIPQTPEMVGNEIVGLAHKSDELLHSAVTPGQSLDQAPPQLVRQELQERGRVDKCRRRCHGPSIYFEATGIARF
jgi:hypothetical protein